MIYTYAKASGGNIYHRYVDNNGKRKNVIVHQTDLRLYTKTNEANYDRLSIFGDKLSCKHFKKPSEMRKWIKDNGDHVDIFGNQDAAIQFLYNTYKDEPMTFDLNRDFVILNFDIETESHKGFPSIANPISEILSISTQLFSTDQFVTFGLKDYEITKPEDIYIKCKDEEELITEFVRYVHRIKPDIMTGWHIAGFDIPYLVERGNRVVGEGIMKYLSPFAKECNNEWNYPIYKSHNGKYSILGINIIDYMDVYDNFTLGDKPENLKLDTVGEFEEVGNKLDYSEYGSLQNFYNKNFQKFIEYNEKDVVIVKGVDQKRGYMTILITASYLALIGLEQYSSTVATWDGLVHREAANNGLVIPPNVRSTIRDNIKGGFVHEVKVGSHRWLVTFDFASLYPNIDIMFNLSPDSLMCIKHAVHGDEYVYELIDSILNDKPHPLSKYAKEHNYMFSANGVMTKKGSLGIIPSLMKKIYFDRKKARKECLENERLYEKTHDIKYKQMAIRLDALQYALKIILNAGYGALLCPYYRYFMLELGEAITANGRMISQYITTAINGEMNRILRDCGYDKSMKGDYKVGGDTDSAMFTFDTIIKALYTGDMNDRNAVADWLDDYVKTSIEPFIHGACQKLSSFMNCDNNHMNMKREAIASQALFRAKKNYALYVIDNEGVRYENPKIKMKGLEPVTARVPRIVRNQLTGDIKCMFEGTQEELLERVSNFKDIFYARDVPATAKPTSISDLDKFMNKNFIGTVTANAKASMAHNRAIIQKSLQNTIEPIKNGDRIKVAALKQGNPFGNDRIAFKEDSTVDKLGITEWVDYDKLFIDSYLGVLGTLTNLKGWSTNRFSPVSTKRFF